MMKRRTTSFALWKTRAHSSLSFSGLTGDCKDCGASLVLLMVSAMPCNDNSSPSPTVMRLQGKEEDTQVNGKFANKTRSEISRRRIEIRRGKHVFNNQFSEQNYKQRFRDDTNDPSIPKNGLHRQNNEEKLRSESRSESSSVKNSASSPVNLDERKSLVDDSINAMSIGNTKAEAVDVSRHVGEDLISGYSKIKCQEGARCNIESNPEEGNGIDVRGACISIEKVEDEKRHEEFNVTRVGPEQNDVPFAPVKEMEHVTPRAVRCMGFKLNSNGLVSETQATKSSWVAAVDARYNAYLNSCIAENPIGVEHCEVALCYCFHWWLIFAAIDRLYNENGPVQFQLCFKRLLRRHIYLDQWDRAVVLCGLQINPSVWVFSIWRC
ncbi:hypothetical protein V6N11_077212 [Hibiscus sabdariffa]|uniref:Uncharacterized protein n=1 Tax=Hibiscus sabdariffa TaxID=183260 RepID=A0ABR2TD32_9ROSI